MHRFSSLKHVPAETRLQLRQRFASYLPSRLNSTFRHNEEVTLTDELMLHLLLNLSIDFESQYERALATYAAVSSPNSSELNLENLIKAGWLRVVWGRITIPFEIAQAVRKKLPEVMPAFVVLSAKRHERTYLITDTTSSDKSFFDVAAAINRKELNPSNVCCQTPKWVAARLWDRTLPDSSNHSASLRVWVDRWSQLGYPSLVPKSVWNEISADAFRKAAINILETEPSLTDWNTFRSTIVTQIALANNQPIINTEGYVPPTPTTLVDRTLWLEGHFFERAMMGFFDSDDIFGLVRLLLADVEAEDNAPAPHGIAKQLFALAIERPELYISLIFSVRQYSMLLADLLLYPATSAVACLLIAQWQSHTSAWDRELITRDNQSSKTIAFADATSVMGHYLEQGSLPPEEAASLLGWFHKNAQPGFIDDFGSGETMLANLRSELTSQSPEILRRIIASLTSTMAQSGFEKSTFAAALDIIDAGRLADDIEPTLIVSLYVQSIEKGDFRLTANRISCGGAAALFKLAMRAPAELRKQFLSPLNVKTFLAAETAADNNPYILAGTFARSLRTHIRILSRATSAWKGVVPNDLLNALIDAIKNGTQSLVENELTSVFSAQYESESLDRPIAADIGAALSALPVIHREQLLTITLKTDEPLLLAHLLSFAPYVTKDRIRERINELTPANAGDIHSLTEARARIEALLSAGMADSAARFIDAEHKLKTLGKIAGRETERLRTSLRLHLLRREWPEIENTIPPPSLPLAEQSAAEETITFYKAIAALNSPSANTHAAEQMFAQLNTRRPDVPAYAVNLFAARVSILLKEDLFSQLQGEAIDRGHQVLFESEQIMHRAHSVDDSDWLIVNCNKALLLLAIGQPGQVIELLTPLQARGMRDSVAAYLAVALARTGRIPEANAILSHAEQLIGETDALRAARAHIASGYPYHAPTSVAEDENPAPRIKAALFDLLQMDPMRQAEILQLPPEPFDEFVIGHIRSAAASVMALVPMMSTVDFTGCEDDLSALIRELLTSRFQFLKWSVPDQPKGGFTAKGNPGERDLLLQKDSTTLAVIEAVVCKTSVGQQNLTRHFQKILGYSTCRLFFHLSYVYLDSIALVLAHLKHTAESDAPSGFHFRGLKDIPFTDSKPLGFSARYGVGYGEVKVVFLVLDLGQQLQRNAAKLAAT